MQSNIKMGFLFVQHSLLIAKIDFATDILRPTINFSLFLSTMNYNSLLDHLIAQDWLQVLACIISTIFSFLVAVCCLFKFIFCN